MTKISTIVPVFNTENYLSNTLTSILNQTFCDFEVILIDDGSTDGSGNLCEEWAKRDSRIKVFHQTNQGLPAARNAGIEKADGDFICFCDSDDIYHSRFMELLLDGFAKYPEVDFVMCRRLYTHEPNIQEEFIENHSIEILSKQKIFKELFSSFQFASVNNKLIRREAIKRLRFRSTATEDIDFNMRLYTPTQDFVVIPQHLYYYYQRPGSILHPHHLSNRIIEEIKGWTLLYQNYFKSDNKDIQSYFMNGVYWLLFNRFSRAIDDRDVHSHINRLIDTIIDDFKGNPYITSRQKAIITSFRLFGRGLLKMKYIYGKIRICFQKFVHWQNNQYCLSI